MDTGLMRAAVGIALLLALASVAHAQTAQQTPLEQALFQRLGAEVQANIQANAKVIELQQRLDAAQAALKARQDGQQKPDEPAK